MNEREARKILFRSMVGEEPIPTAEEVDEAKKQLEGNVAFHASIHQLLHVITDQSLDKEKENWTPLLTEYINAQLQGREKSPEFAAIRRQLDMSVSLADKYSQLYQRISLINKLTKVGESLLFTLSVVVLLYTAYRTWQSEQTELAFLILLLPLPALALTLGWRFAERLSNGFGVYRFSAFLRIATSLVVALLVTLLLNSDDLFQPTLVGYIPTSGQITSEIDPEVQRQITQLQAELANRDEQITQLSQQLQAMALQLQQNQGQLAFFANPTTIVPLAGTDSAPTAGGVFYQHGTQALLILHGLPPLPADQTYQLWLIPTDGAPVSVGLLTVQSTDVNRQQVSLPPDALDYQAVGISIEPADGSPTPSAANIVLVGERT